MNEHDLENFNAESDRIDSIMFRDGVEYNHDSEIVHVDTAWAAGFVNVEGEPMN